MDKTVLKWFGVEAQQDADSALAKSASVGDLVNEEVQSPVLLSNQQAEALLQALVACGAWSGLPGAIEGCSIVKQDSGIQVTCRGLKLAKSEAFPSKAVAVKGRAELVSVDEKEPDLIEKP